MIVRNAVTTQEDRDLRCCAAFAELQADFSIDVKVVNMVAQCATIRAD
jgi:hypothetical protein